MADRHIIEHLHAEGLLYATAERSASDMLDAARLLPAQDLLLVRWALQGQATGHEWCGCSECGALRLMKPPTEGTARARCKMTSACEGVMQRIAPRPRLTKSVRDSLCG